MIEKIRELEARIAGLERILNMTVRVGEVVARDVDNCRVRVQFRDAENIVTYWCSVVMKKTKIDKEYWLPDLGEMVLCIFPYFDCKHGYVIGSLYNDKDIPPTFAGPGQYVLHDQSGNVFVMDREKEQFYVVTERLNVVGDLLVTGNIYTRGHVVSEKNVYDALGNLTTHRHPDTLPREAGVPGPPVPEVELPKRDPSRGGTCRRFTDSASCTCGCRPRKCSREEEEQ